MPLCPKVFLQIRPKDARTGPQPPPTNPSNTSTYKICTIPKWSFTKFLSEPKEVKPQSLLLWRQQRAPKKRSSSNVEFCDFFLRQGDRTPRNHERTRVKPGSWDYSSPVQTQSPTFQTHLQPKGTRELLSRQPGVTPKAGQGQALLPQPQPPLCHIPLLP